MLPMKIFTYDKRQMLLRIKVEYILMNIFILIWKVQVWGISENNICLF